MTSKQMMQAKRQRSNLEPYLPNILSISDPTRIRVSGQVFWVGGGAGAAFGRSNEATLGGMLAGALAGAVVQNAMETGNGIEYTIAFADGSTQILDQLQGPGDPIFQPGAAVMVEFGATKHKILSAANLPDMVAHPKEVRVAGAPKPSTIKVQSCAKTKSADQERKVCTEQ